MALRSGAQPTCRPLLWLLPGSCGVSADTLALRAPRAVEGALASCCTPYHFFPVLVLGSHRWLIGYSCGAQEPYGMPGIEYWVSPIISVIYFRNTAHWNSCDLIFSFSHLRVYSVRFHAPIWQIHRHPQYLVIVLDL